jgi:Tol biopolymer transport system component
MAILLGGVTLSAEVDPCSVASIVRSDGMRVESPDGKRILVNKEDVQGVAQVYIAQSARPTHLTCLTCTQQTGGPRPNRRKMQPVWHPSGDYIIMAVERDTYAVPPVLGWVREIVEGWLESGLYTDMWALRPQNLRWTRLTDFNDWGPNGYTGPAFTKDGKRGVWSQIMDGNIIAYNPFGRWELTLGEWSVVNGVPAWRTIQNITPPGMHWNEPGNFTPDNKLVLTGSTLSDAQGQDQYLFDLDTKELTNLTNSDTVWDEHGIASPSGQKITLMSALPFYDPDASKVFSIKTELMLMNRDGSDIRRLTYFYDPSHAEYSEGIAAHGVWSADGRQLSVRQLVFPNYRDWTLTFAGACGR